MRLWGRTSKELLLRTLTGDVCRTIGRIIPGSGECDKRLAKSKWPAAWNHTITIRGWVLLGEKRADNAIMIDLWKARPNLLWLY